MSWLPDPEATACDAFSLSWSNEIIYAFPPFSVIDRVLQKLEDDGAMGIVVFPLWTTQHWFPRLLRLLMAAPLALPKKGRLLHLPYAPERRHPLEGQVKICAALLSGSPSHREAFQTTLSTLSSAHRVQSVSTHLPSGSGYTSVLNGQLIQFKQL